MRVTCHGCDQELDAEDVRGETLHGWPLCWDCHYQSHASDGICWDGWEADEELNREAALDAAEVKEIDAFNGED